MNGSFLNSLQAFQGVVDGAIADAVATSDYDQVQILAELAATLRATPKRLTAAASADVPRSQPVSPKNDRGENPTRSPSQYPYYLRDRDDVLKVGWASKSNSTYEHRAPFADVLLFANALKEVSKSGALFSTKELRTCLALAWRRQERDPLPDSQFYVCLGWLKSIGAVVQHGRRGYSVTDSRMLGDGLETAFAVLPVSHPNSPTDGDQ